MTLNHTPNTNDNLILPNHANARRQIRQLRQYGTHPDYAIDLFTAAMVEIATALRKAKRTSQCDRRSI